MRILDLGPLEVERMPGGPLLRVVGGKQIALLSALCLRRGARVTRDELRVAGWGEDAVVTDATIENHVWRLRKTLEPGREAAASRLVNDVAGYRLDLPAASVDSSLFELAGEQARAAARGGDYSEALRVCDDALGLWRGEPFAELAHVTALQGSIARLFELRGQLSEWRIDALLAVGEAERAVLDGEALIGADPYRERLWAQRMTALARLGRSEEALRVFQQVRGLLHDELGLEPGRELRELQRAIIAQEHDDVGDRAEPGVSAGGVSARTEPEEPPRWSRPEWPLVGRSADVERLVRALGEGATGIIRGAAGVGKTRLLDEVLRVAHTQGSRVVRVVATHSAAAVPLGVFADLLPAGVRSDDPLVLLRQSARALAAADGRPLVLGIDDAHLLDGPSAALALHLASAGTATVVIATRTGEGAPDAVRALATTSGVVRVDLAPLDADTAARLVDAVLSGPAESAIHRWVHRNAGGNAFYAVELIRAARASGDIRLEGGRWLLDEAPQIPGSLAEVVKSTLDRLEPGPRRVLDILAVGEPVRVADLSALAVRDDVVALDRAGLIAVDGAGSRLWAVIAHPLYATVVRATLSALGANDIRTDLVSRYAARAESLEPHERLRLAQWRLAAGDPIDTTELTEAAGLALAANDPTLAIELGTFATAESDAAGGAGDVQARLHLARGHVLRREYDDAAAALEDLEPSLHTPQQAIAYLNAQREVKQWGQARPEELRELLGRALQWWSDDAWRARIAAIEDDVTVFERLGSRHPDARETETTESARIGSLFYAGRSAEALALCRAVQGAPPFVEPDQAITAAVGARIELERGDDLAGLESRLLRMRDLGLDSGDPAAAGIASYALAELRMLQADAPAALGLLTEAARYLERRDPAALRAAVLAGTALAARETGDAARGASALGRMHDLVEGRPLAHLLPYVARAEAWAAADRGDRTTALAVLAEAATRLQSSPIHRGRLLYEAMQIGADIATVASALRVAAAECDAPLVALYAGHAAARAGGDAAGLRAVADRMERYGLSAYRDLALADIDAV